jgi:hypothetical protein
MCSNKGDFLFKEFDLAWNSKVEKITKTRFDFNFIVIKIIFIG